MENLVSKAMTTDKNNWRAQRRNQLNLPSYTVAEEIMSAISHGVGALLAAAALVILLVFTPHDAITVVSVSVYGGTLFLLYTVSTLYHALGISKAKKVFQVLDHCTVFLLIAGTYTPITLLCLRGVLGWVMFSVVWAAAIVGITLNGVNMKRFRAVSMICYICMGWVVLFAIKPLIANLDFAAVLFLFAGGIFYTVGAVIYGKGRTVKYMHALWHIFVLAGSILHFLVVYHIAVKP